MEILQTWGTAMDPFCGMLEENAAKTRVLPCSQFGTVEPTGLGCHATDTGSKEITVQYCSLDSRHFKGHH